MARLPRVILLAVRANNLDSANLVEIISRSLEGIDRREGVFILLGMLLNVNYGEVDEYTSLKCTKFGDVGGTNVETAACSILQASRCRLTTLHNV